jgi:hypothetical protein
MENKTADDKEKYLYKEIKEIPAVGAAYSVARMPIYMLKGNKGEAVFSGVNTVFGSATTALKCGASMINAIDKETEKAMQKISRVIIPLVSKKVMEKVVNNELSLEEGLKVVDTVETKCEALVAVESDKIKRQSLEKAAVSSSYAEVPLNDEVQGNEKSFIRFRAQPDPTHLQESVESSQNCFHRLWRVMRFKGSKTNSKEKFESKTTEKEDVQQSGINSIQVSSTDQTQPKLVETGDAMIIII